MLTYALTIFTGAFLLFQVQPLIGKFILPWFGGGPGVWTTCLLFFQVLLLGGYAYAHLSTTRLKPRTQAAVHLALIALALALLPITPAESWKTHLAGNPTGHILLLLTACLGLPYFVLSATGPLLQRWFSETHPGVSPYRLYALSNLGSLLALLSYPLYFERTFSRQTQANLWSAGLVLFAVGGAYCAWRLGRGGGGSSALKVESLESGTGTPEPEGAISSDPQPTTLNLQPPVPSRWDRALWLGLPAVASVLLLATTNKLCQEVAVVPFLWVLPLSLYLLSFIVCFDHERWYLRGLCSALLVVGLAVVCHLLVERNSAPLWQQVTGYAATLFVACLVCHGELYRLRPPPRYLTSFYLHLAAGGALGGFLVAIVAPVVFNDYWELPAGYWVLSYFLGVLCFRQRSRALALGAGVGALAATLVVPALRLALKHSLGFPGELGAFYYAYWPWDVLGLAVFAGCVCDWRSAWLLREWRPRMGAFLMAASVGFGLVLLVVIHEDEDRISLSSSRNFYGTLKVFEYRADEPESHYYLLMHGATTHGLQFANPPQSAWPTSYYAETSGVGLAIRHLPRQEGKRLGFVGLGAGTLATYGAKGDYLRFYEINPAVERLARSRFTYLAQCPATVDVVMGDARLSMERELADAHPQQFDLLALDAFSSDAIPVHLLTREAFALYLRELKPDGVIAVHTSNRYLDLVPVVQNLAREFGLGVAIISDDEEDDRWWIYRTTWILVTRNRALLEQEAIHKATDDPPPVPPGVGVWTDDRTSLLEILR